MLYSYTIKYEFYVIHLIIQTEAASSQLVDQIFL